jgi:hypothetical protein
MNETKQSKTPNYSIYLNPKEKNVVENVNAYQGYIINMNDKLKREYDEMKEELIEVKRKLDQRDDELDHEEKTSTNLRGATHNINAMNQINQKIKNQYIKYQENTEKLIKARNEQLQFLINSNVIFIAITLLVCVIMWYIGAIASNHIIFHITYCIINLGITLYVEQLYSSDNMDSNIVSITNKYMPLIKQNISDLNELVSTNDYLSEYIDSL